MIYFSPFLIIGLSAWGIYQMGNFVWTATVILFIAIPIIEILMRNIRLDPTKHKSKWGEVSLALTPVGLTSFLLLTLYQSRAAQSTSEIIGLGVSSGVVLGAIGITAAHELVHRRDSFHRALGVWNLVLVNFAHWGIEHVYGHHKHAATPVDPASARKNEWLYPFWFRNYFGVLFGAWHISKYKVTAYWVGSVILSGLVYLVFGSQAVIVWWIASVMGTLLLQTVDYIEHYGLVRPKNSDGFYTAFKANHAWDTASVATNINLYNLGLHSHHHQKALVPFQDLSQQPGEMKMPFGYSVMFLMAFIPVVYIPFMNKRLL